MHSWWHPAAVCVGYDFDNVASSPARQSPPSFHSSSGPPGSPATHISGAVGASHSYPTGWGTLGSGAQQIYNRLTYDGRNTSVSTINKHYHMSIADE